MKLKRFVPIVLAALIALLYSCSTDERDMPFVPTLPTSPGISNGGNNDNMDNEESDMMKISIGEKAFYADFADTEAAKSFKSLLPVEIRMEELNGNEKYYYFDTELPVGPTVSGSITAGDLMLYGRECLVLFYESFRSSYSYTPIGHISDNAGLAEALGRGSVTIKIELK